MWLHHIKPHTFLVAPRSQRGKRCLELAEEWGSSGGGSSGGYCGARFFVLFHLNFPFKM